MSDKKFRIWDIETKQFFYWDITQTPPSCLTKKYIKENSNQFTNLLDKNGVEIYEGDIVKCGNTIEVIEPPKFHDTGEGWAMFGYGITDNIDIEVIGNIYQNPELLNVKS